MCGICGKVAQHANKISDELLTRMRDTLVYRGPDDAGSYHDEHVILGQRRLSIIDLDPTATAPLANEAQTVWLVFNGEIYNYRELRAELIREGHVFRTESDTEVIVHLYESKGEDCVSELRGMFAFAIWDSVQQRLFCARDRLGQKPFYYHYTSGSFVFGSEIKAITADPSVTVSPNLRALDQFLTWSYIPAPLTAFEGVHALLPGHCLGVSLPDCAVIVRPYWQPKLQSDSSITDRQEAQERIRILLTDAVNTQMVADVPLGALLSGGIDSAAVVALMAQKSSRPINTFSIGLDDASMNELPQARLVAERYGTNHHELIVEPQAAEVLPLLVRHYNQPFADPSAIPTYYVSQLARQEVTVALSGDGGDESFSGYTRYGGIMRWAIFNRIPGIRMLARKAAALAESIPYNNRTARIARGLHMIQGSLKDRYLLEMSLFKPQEKRCLYTPKFADAIHNGGLSEQMVQLAWRPNHDPYQWMMSYDQMFYLPDCLNVKTDIASMACSLELRAPFLDHLLVEYMYEVPSSWRRCGQEGKLILKEVLRSLLPDDILHKPKSGFGIPIAKWLRTDLVDMLRRALLSDRAARRGLFDPPRVALMVDEHLAGRRDWSNRLWALLNLELWFQTFIDKGV